MTRTWCPWAAADAARAADEAAWAAARAAADALAAADPAAEREWQIRRLCELLEDTSGH